MRQFRLNWVTAAAKDNKQHGQSGGRGDDDHHNATVDKLRGNVNKKHENTQIEVRVVHQQSCITDASFPKLLV